MTHLESYSAFSSMAFLELLLRFVCLKNCCLIFYFFILLRSLAPDSTFHYYNYFYSFILINLKMISKEDYRSLISNTLSILFVIFQRESYISTDDFLSSLSRATKRNLTAAVTDYLGTTPFFNLRVSKKNPNETMIEFRYSDFIINRLLSITY